VSKTFVILDTSAILASPEILSHVRNQNLLIPMQVIDELRSKRKPDGERLTSLVQQAIAKGAQVPERPEKINMSAFGLTQASLEGADIEIALVAVDYADRFGGQNVLVVTLDKALSQLLSSRGIKTQTPQAFSSSTKGDSTDPEVRSIARRLTLRELLDKAVSSLSGAVVLLAVEYGHTIYGFAKQYLSVTALCLVLSVIGLAAYWWRQHFRLSYGSCETVVGLYITYGAAANVVDGSPLTSANWLQIVAGLYVVVRGLDNFGKGLAGTRYERYWISYFGKV